MADRPPATERPGIEPVGRSGVRPRRSEVVFGLLLGVAVSAVLVAVMPDVRRHMFGGTERHTTTVVAAESHPRDDDGDREVGHYRLTWRDDDGATHTSTLKRSGPLRRQVGDTWDLWVSPDHPAATDEPPWVDWALLGLGIPLFSLAIGWLIGWRQRVMVRATLSGERRRRDREAITRP